MYHEKFPEVETRELRAEANVGRRLAVCEAVADH